MGSIQLEMFRRTDPPTCKFGAESVNVETLRYRMIDASRMLAKPATARELAEFAAFHRDEVESLRKRTGELKRRGMLVVVGKRCCRFTGRLAETLEAKK